MSDRFPIPKLSCLLPSAIVYQSGKQKDGLFFPGRGAPHHLVGQRSNARWACLDREERDFTQKMILFLTFVCLENFLDMIHVSQNNTNVLFSEVYKKMDGVAREPVSQLYQDLSSYIEGRTQDLETHISTFFDALFPLVYHHSINPKLKDFSDDYKECLRQTRREIRPFGDIADRATQQLTRSFSVARTLLDAFEVGVEVVSATSSMRFRPDCDAGLMKMVYCSHCSGFARTKPCGGYCLNVVRGCLAHVAELDQPWSDFVSGLERLTSGLVASYNIEEVLSVLDTKISEAIMYAMENGPELSKKVFRSLKNIEQCPAVPLHRANFSCPLSKLAQTPRVFAEALQAKLDHISPQTNLVIEYDNVKSAEDPISVSYFSESTRLEHPICAVTTFPRLTFLVSGALAIFAMRWRRKMSAYSRLLAASCLFGWTDITPVWVGRGNPKARSRISQFFAFCWWNDNITRLPSVVVCYHSGL
ncbi:Glypican-5 [Araneus ventricosus]|uniref:Glypican-5 n=1 Tax=Araneus ventricosus TaxID=182803 RepID=A0A4Y2FMY3_ARAVE|nr:Glypican-5 [Araneus ventricosus]